MSYESVCLNLSREKKMDQVLTICYEADSNHPSMGIKKFIVVRYFGSADF